MYVSTASFAFKDESSKDAFLNILRGEKGLVITRAWKGCLGLQVFVDNENSNTLFIIGNWEAKENHESYLQMRKDTGLFEQVVATLEGQEKGLAINSYSVYGI